MVSLPHDNLDYPALITAGNSKGSGFFVNTASSNWIATAKHVLFRADGALISNTGGVVTYSQRFQHRISFTFDYAAALSAGELIPSPTADVAMLRFGDMLVTHNADGTETRSIMTTAATSNVIIPPGGKIIGMGFENFVNFNDVGIGNEAFVFGYPMSVGQAGQLEPEKPLVRRGAVAGINQLNRTVILDASVYQGNSGGLVIEVIPGFPNYSFRGIGLVSQFVPFVERLQSLNFGTINTALENSGYAIVEPWDKCRDLIPQQYL